MAIDSIVSATSGISVSSSATGSVIGPSTELFESITASNHGEKFASALTAAHQSVTERPTYTVLSSDTPSVALQQRQILDKQRKIKEFSAEFYRTIEHDHFEFGVTANIERMVERWIARDLKTTQLALAQLFQDNQRSEKIVVGILKVIAHIDPETLQPMNRTVASSALSLPSAEVRECAVRAYEYWERADFMVDLEVRPLSPAWLEEYKQTVIAEAKG
ncbi:hypothetical protein ACBQ21_13265 [Pseudomonas putida]|uniref:hypothetical protein n=1 Tax=Pseudomonas putida TaxID=303 RepID=UPI0035236D07